MARQLRVLGSCLIVSLLLLPCSAVAQEGLEMARRGGGIGWIGWIEGTLGGIELLQGDLDAAERWTRASLEDAIAAGDQPLAGTRHVDLALVLLLRGDPVAAAEDLSRGAVILEDQPEPQITPTLRRIEEQLARTAGDEEAAVALLWESAEALAASSVDQDPRGIIELVRLLVERGEREEARRARELLSRGASPFSRAGLHLADGLRFNLVAREFDTEPLEKALRHFDETAVEVPVIPERIPEMKEMVLRLDALGVPFLNIHELFACRENSTRVVRKGYASGGETGEALSWEPVAGADEAALSLLLFALERTARLSVYYCSCKTQQDISRRGMRRRLRLAAA